MNGDTVHSGITRVVSRQAVYGHGIKHLAIDTWYENNNNV